MTFDENHYITKMERMLLLGGGTHTVEDLTHAIARGTMQSWVNGNSWAITQILVFPRKKIVEIFAVVGDLPELDVLEDRIVDFAREIKADMIRSFGRHGWLKRSKRLGWQCKQMVFVKELT